MSANADKKPKMPIFRDRLDKLRGDMSYSEFAEKLGISRATMGFYLAGNRVPNAVDLKKIAERCEVSADYLLGMSDAAKAENHEIGYALGLSDKSISKLKRFAENKFSKIALNQILESGKIIAYITNYLFSFLEDERKESRFRYVPLSRNLDRGYADMNLVKLIELLPLWRKDTINQLKAQIPLIDSLLKEYVAKLADVDMCKREYVEFVLYEEPYIPNPDDILPDDFYANIDYEDEYRKEEEYEREEAERRNAIGEILDFISEKRAGEI